MKIKTILLITVALVLGKLVSLALGEIEPHFVPGEDVTAVVVHEIEHAARTVLIQSYNFTCPKIAKACVDAAKRGVQVIVLIDSGVTNQPGCQALYMKEGGVSVRVDAKHSGIAHNKIMVIDYDKANHLQSPQGRVLTGSFNFSTSAQTRNAENLLIIRVGDHDQEEMLAVCLAYYNNWQSHYLHTELYDPNPEPEAEPGLVPTPDPAPRPKPLPKPKPGKKPSRTKKPIPAPLDIKDSDIFQDPPAVPQQIPDPQAIQPGGNALDAAIKAQGLKKTILLWHKDISVERLDPADPKGVKP